MTEPTATPLLPSAAYSLDVRQCKGWERNTYDNLGKNTVVLGLDINGGLVCFLTREG
jgi:hypothetical protein